MAMSVKEVTDWLNEVSDFNHVAIDDGGLALVEVESKGADGEYNNYLEIGGVPEEEGDGNDVG